jgi:hypothetical protein
MIDLNELVYKINEHIGLDKFQLSLHTNGFPDKNEKRIVGTFNATRVPYGFSTAEIDAESLAVTLTFDVPCGDLTSDRKRDEVLEIFKNKLLGWQSLTVEQVDGSTYTANLFLEMQAPSAPYVDSGYIIQQIVIAGNALVQNATCGAVVGNKELFYINGYPVLKTSKVSSTQYAGDNNLPLSEGGSIAEVDNITKGTTVQVTCLYMGSEIDKELYGIANGESYDINKVYLLQTELNGDKFPHLDAKLVSVVAESAVGVFVKYTATFQVIPS